MEGPIPKLALCYVAPLFFNDDAKLPLFLFSFHETKARVNSVSISVDLPLVVVPYILALNHVHLFRSLIVRCGRFCACVYFSKL